MPAPPVTTMVGMAAFFLGNWITRLYLGAVITAAFAPHPAYLIGLTSPVSIIFAPVFLLGDGWLTTPMYVGSVLAGYLLNTVVLNLIVGGPARASHRRPARRAASDQTLTYDRTDCEILTVQVQPGCVEMRM
jgi:hypothetical protein